MKNILVTLLFLVSIFSILNAEDVTGESVYKSKCASCHALDTKKEMTSKERTAMMKEQKAPPMAKVSAKVRDAFKEDTNKSVAFVADYIVNPDMNKSLCMPMALKKFGIMPAIGKSMKSNEIEVVSKWLVTSFDGNWTKMMETKCKGKVKDDRCCAGTKKPNRPKCGGDNISRHPSMKLSTDSNSSHGSKKCGGDRLPKHPGMKCGSDKNSSKKCGGGK